MNWARKRVVVTGGAGFIGSTMVDRLLELGADVLVVDKLQLAVGSLAWNRKLARLEGIFRRHGINQVPLEICDLETEMQRFQIIASKADAVFHLSAVFGGREFVDTRQADCSKMLAVDHNAIEASFKAGVERFHYSSSACFPAGTKVWTPGGTRNIEDLAAGEQVIDHLGQVGRISRTSSRWHQGQVRRVWIAGFDRPIEATPEHPFLTNERGSFHWTPAKRLDKGAKILVPKILITGSRPIIDLRPMMTERESAYVEVRQNTSSGRAASIALMAAHGVKDPEIRYYGWVKYGEKPPRLRAVEEIRPTIEIDQDVAWWLGMYVAEGWTQGHGADPAQILIALGEEPDLEAKIIDVASRKLGLRIHRQEMKRQKGVKLEASHPLLAKWLAENFGTGARAKKVPRFILQADEITIRSFLRGYLEGDGCFYERSDGRRPRITWGTASKDLAEGLNFLLARLGLSAGYKVRKPSKFVQGRHVRAVELIQSYIDGWQSVELLHQLGLTSSRHSTSQKYQRARRIANQDGEWTSRSIVKVEDVPFVGLVYNCEVRQNHSFCVGDGVAVHNCVYPDSLQKDPTYLLKEDDILSTGEGWKSSDNLYGFAKLMGELQCVVFHKEKGMKTSACRYLTVYGPGELDTSHAISALIEKALDRMDPYVVWGSGCLPPDALVFAGGHFERISQIQVGDSIEDHTGNFQLVLNRFKRHYEGDMYEIKGMGLSPLRLTTDHLVMVVKLGTFCKVGRPHYCKPNCFCMNYSKYHRHRHLESDPKISVQWLRADQLEPTTESGEYLIFPKLKIQSEPALIKLDRYRSPKSNYRSELYRDIEVSPDFAFLLGWYTAEGWTNWSKSNRGRTRKGAVTMALGPAERPVGLSLMRIAKEHGFSPYIRTRKPRNPKHKTTFEVGFPATGLAKWLRDNVGAGARNKRVPRFIFHASKEVIERYLEGLFEGDGNKTPYGERLTSTSTQLLLDVQVLLSAIGKFGCVSLPESDKGWGIVEWSNERYNKFWQDSENIYTPIVNVDSKAYVGLVHDIETADHTFAAPIIVHNSQQRGFTYSTDIVNGSIAACEKVEDGSGINLGWDKRYKIKDVAEMILRVSGHKPSKVAFDLSKPEGPFSRALDISMARRVLGWEPKVDLEEGLQKTIAWHKELRAQQALSA